MLALLLPLALAQAPDRTAAAPTCPARIASLPLPATVSRDDPRLLIDGLIVVRKAARQVARYDDGMLVDTPEGPACWWAGLSATDDPAAWQGTKTRRGDLKTPEGFYATSDKPWSSFYGAIAVHYPDGDDARRGVASGLVDEAMAARIAADSARGVKPPQTTRLGGEILIHGGGGRADWTLGCVALDDDDIDALRASLGAPMTTTVLVLP